MHIPKPKNRLRRVAQISCAGGLALFLSNCAAPKGLPAGIEAGKSYLISRDGVSLYETPNSSVFDNPDYLLESGERVSVLGGNDREIEVELTDGVIGFISPIAVDSATTGPGTNTQPKSRREVDAPEVEEVAEAPKKKSGGFFRKKKEKPVAEPEQAMKKPEAKSKEVEKEPKKKSGGFFGRKEKPAPTPEPVADESFEPDDTPAPPKAPGGVLPLPDVRSSGNTPSPVEKPAPTPTPTPDTSDVVPVDDVATPAPTPIQAPSTPAPTAPVIPPTPDTTPDAPAVGLPGGGSIPIPPPPVPQPPDLDDLQLEPIE